MEISVAAVVYRDGRLLLGKRKAGGSMGGRWELPGGKVEGEESPQQALVREFEEELGASIRVGELLAVGGFEHKGIQRRLEAYLAFLVAKNNHTEIEFSRREHDDFCWVEPENVLQYHLVDSDRAILPDILTALAEI